MLKVCQASSFILYEWITFLKLSSFRAYIEAQLNLLDFLPPFKKIAKFVLFFSNFEAIMENDLVVYLQ